MSLRPSLALALFCSNFDPTKYQVVLQCARRIYLNLDFNFFFREIIEISIPFSEICYSAYNMSGLYLFLSPNTK